MSKSTLSARREPLTFIVAVDKRKVFESNFLASPCLQGDHGHQILVREGFPSATIAYNSGIVESKNEIMVFCHQDMIFPATWPSQLEIALEYLRGQDPEWGVLGCYGETRAHDGRGHIYSTGLGILGQSFPHPLPVQTLDEIVLIVRKSSGLRFDDLMPHFHFYGSDICMRAAEKGMNTYAISAFCVHNTQQYLALPEEFYECYKYFKRNWKDRLPIQTSCIKVARFDLEVHKRKFKEIIFRIFKRDNVEAFREENVGGLLQRLISTNQGGKDSDGESLFRPAEEVPDRGDLSTK
jgi:hypothetical protein